MALRSGELHFPAGRQRLAGPAAAAAYLLLLIYTAALLVAIFQAVLNAQDAVAAWIALAGYMAAYPLIYMAVAWVFHHSLKKP